MSKLPISVFIICKNEADRIATTIKSVCGWVDEIVVVDSGSTDGTVEVAKAAGADKVMFNEWSGYGAQKVFAQNQCRNNWVLNLDADEEISSQLQVEICNEFATMPSEKNAYRLRCVMTMMHEKTPSRFAFVNDPVRLYHLGNAGFSDNMVHDSVVLRDGAIIKKFEGAVLHRSFRSLAHMEEKLNNYSTMQATEMFDRGKKVSVLRAFFEPFLMFPKFYFGRRYFAHGFYGIAAARIYAHYRFLRLAKLREKWAVEKLRKSDKNTQN